ncbi:hypothetical protein [Actinomadura parmotrematis]|uniref:ESX-1 secretion-associated protein n=1 Tax=Actinomadura parmotrematis TaxID=2864039 RepID=A0ABS7FX38_9ACTN|nr:hypothetical protein [Actinomadura parmotrematis]MBW8484152.1 hypothetical protein [Actinomadura parmotrematis]
MSPGGETRYNVRKLMTAAEHLDGFSDRAKTTEAASKARPAVSGHEWGLVGAAFSVNYGQLVKELNEHLGMISTFLVDAERSMTQTARHYAGADEKILARIKQLETDPPVMSPPKKK